MITLPAAMAIVLLVYCYHRRSNQLVTKPSPTPVVFQPALHLRRNELSSDRARELALRSATPRQS